MKLSLPTPQKLHADLGISQTSPNNAKIDQIFVAKEQWSSWWLIDQSFFFLHITPINKCLLWRLSNSRFSLDLHKEWRHLLWDLGYPNALLWKETHGTRKGIIVQMNLKKPLFVWDLQGLAPTWQRRATQKKKQLIPVPNLEKSEWNEDSDVESHH